MVISAISSSVAIHRNNAQGTTAEPVGQSSNFAIRRNACLGTSDQNPSPGYSSLHIAIDRNSARYRSDRHSNRQEEHMHVTFCHMSSQIA